MDMDLTQMVSMENLALEWKLLLKHSSKQTG